MATRQDVYAAKDRLLSQLAKTARAIPDDEIAYVQHMIVQRLDQLSNELQELRENRS